MRVYAGTAGMLDVRLHGGPPIAFLCQDGAPEGFGVRDIARLPALSLPPDASPVYISSPVGLGTHAATGATLRTDMSVADLEAFVAEQLIAAGWTRRGGGSEGLLAWSSWAVPEREGWRAFLTAVAEPESHIRYLRLELRSPAVDGSPRRP